MACRFGLVWWAVSVYSRGTFRRATLAVSSYKFTVTLEADEAGDGQWRATGVMPKAPPVFIIAPNLEELEETASNVLKNYLDYLRSESRSGAQFMERCEALGIKCEEVREDVVPRVLQKKVLPQGQRNLQLVLGDALT